MCLAKPKINQNLGKSLPWIIFPTYIICWWGWGKTTFFIELKNGISGLYWFKICFSVGLPADILKGC